MVNINIHSRMSFILTCVNQNEGCYATILINNAKNIETAAKQILDHWSTMSPVWEIYENNLTDILFDYKNKFMMEEEYDNSSEMFEDELDYRMLPKKEYDEFVKSITINDLLTCIDNSSDDFIDDEQSYTFGPASLIM